MPLSALMAVVDSGALDDTWVELGATGGAPMQKARLRALAEAFAARYGVDREVALFTVSGRSELSGNHTDHNHGRVIAASISLDMLAIAARRDDSVVRLYSEGFGENVVDLTRDTTPDPARFGTSASLIAGVCVGLSDAGYTVGGFDACTTSDVLPGSGLSSSAAFEDMVGLIQSHLYNDGDIDEVTIAKISQFAENRFFGKPCGLMDQIACAIGGIVTIDFADPATPVITPLPFDMTTAGYHLCIVNTGGNHADLTDDYAAVPAEMKAVAAHFGREVLREVDEDAVVAAIPALREAVGDRAVMRALHFFAENRRVKLQSNVLQAAIEATTPEEAATPLRIFFRCVRDSGRSSFEYLQNVYTTKNVSEQGLSLALCLCDRILGEAQGAYRIHGGGFAGTVQAFVPTELVPDFTAAMDAAFGAGATKDLKIRSIGAARLL